jgi:hypothetical protein
MSRPLLFAFMLLSVGLKSEVFSQEYTYGTFIGGSHAEQLHCIAASESGYYVGGTTHGDGFPITITGYQQSGDPLWYSREGVIIRFDDDDLPTAATYVGGDGDDVVFDIVVVPDGVIAAIRTGSRTFHAEYSGAPSNETGLPNVMIVKYSLDLDELLWVRWVAGNEYDYVFDIDANATHAVVTGQTTSSNLPTDNVDPAPWPLFANIYAMTLDVETGEVLAFRYFPTGKGTSCQVLDNGDVLLAGYSGEPLPVSESAVDTELQGIDAYLGRYDAQLQQQWLTYMGGTEKEYVAVVRWDEQHNRALLLVETESDDLAVQKVNWPADYAGACDAYSCEKDLYFCSISGDGSQLDWGGYLGVVSEWPIDENRYPEMELDDQGNMIVTVSSKAREVPVGDLPLFTSPISLQEHGFMLNISTRNRVWNWASYLPGEAFSRCSDVTLKDGVIRLVGTYSTNYEQEYLEPTPDALDSVIEGASEGFMIRINDDTIVGIDPPSFSTTITLPHIQINWLDDGLNYTADVRRGTNVRELPVVSDGLNCTMEDILTASEQASGSIYQVRHSDNPNTVLYEYVLNLLSPSAADDLAVSTTTNAVILHSPDFTADCTVISLYDLRGRRVHRSESQVSFQDDRPVHVLSWGILPRLSAGAFVVTVEYGDRKATGKLIVVR